MSARVTPFPRRPFRGWFLVPLSPGLWAGHLYMEDGTVIECLPAGSLRQVESSVKASRYRVPIVRLAPEWGRGPETAA